MLDNRRKRTGDKRRGNEKRGEGTGKEGQAKGRRRGGKKDEKRTKCMTYIGEVITKPTFYFSKRRVRFMPQPPFY